MPVKASRRSASKTAVRRVSAAKKISGSKTKSAKAASATAVKAKSGLKTARVAKSMAATKSGYLSAFYNERGNLAVERVASGFGMSKTQLAETVGISRETFYKPTRTKALKVQSRVREMVEIVERVKDWSGGRNQAIAWYRSQPIPAFGGRTAESIVKDGKAGDLRDYLDAIALGGFA